MGGRIQIENTRDLAGESFGDIIVKSSSLKTIIIPQDIIPNIIDEIPILSVASLLAEGEFKINYAEELRYKESDRIKSLVHNYKILGLDAEEYPDGFTVKGEIKNKKVILNSFNDHRIAMAFAILSVILNGESKVDNFDCVKISNPDFLFQLKELNR
jgi:3-phosphoshikimate 1-carboxyvinyltransferase